MAAPRKDNVKDKILNTAVLLLKEKALSDISLAQIANEAGVSKGTLYYYFKNKDDILFEITDRYLSKQWEELIKWSDDKNKDTSVYRLVKYVVERNVASSDIRMHLISSAMNGDEVIRKKLINRYGEFQSLISKKIAERTDFVSADYLSWLILTASDGIIIQEALKNENINIDNFISESSMYIKMLENYSDK